MAESEKQEPPKIIEKHFSDTARCTEAIDMVATNVDGKVVQEISIREDARKEGQCHVDMTAEEPRIRVLGRRTAPLDNLADENEYTAAFAVALGKANGRTFVLEEKTEEDSDFPDVWLRDVESGEREGVQVTQLDVQAISALGREGLYQLEFATAAIAGAASVAIAKKNQIDAKLAAKSYLLLICPYPLRPAVHVTIAAAVADIKPEKKYKETWIASLKETAFRVQG